MLGYQGLSSRSSIQRQSGSMGRRTQTGTPSATGQVGDRRVDGDHQVELTHERRRVGEILQPGARVQYVQASPQHFHLLAARALLQADQPDAWNTGYGLKDLQGDGTPAGRADGRGFPARRSRS